MEHHEEKPKRTSRRNFLGQALTAAGTAIAAPSLLNQATAAKEARSMQSPEGEMAIKLMVNGEARSLTIEPRMTLLDTLRERLELTGSKKGCDHGQCGACTVLVNGHRVLSCLTLAASCEGKTVHTIEGLAQGNQLHPVQEAFLKHDGFQCGFCTPGQICAAVALLDEAKKGHASYVTETIRKPAGPVKLSNEEIRERMSGNICRCGAYPNIVAAIQEVHSGKSVEQ